MANPTPSAPHAALDRGIQVDAEQIPGKVVISVVTTCGRVAETAILDRGWYEMYRDDGRSIDLELRASLDKRCTPWQGDERCIKCPFAGTPHLRVV